MSSEPSRYHGLYRGTVANNVDPMRQARIQAQVPDVLGSTPSSWALPCLPGAGPQMGHYMVPPVGAGVWVAFEQGDVNFPVWVGCWYGSAGEIPAQALAGNPASPNILVQTTGQQSILLSDVPGMGIVLRTASGAMLMINDAGIVIDNGKGATITLTGPTVSVNKGALTVT